MTDKELLEQAKEYQRYLLSLKFRADMSTCLKHILLEDHDELTAEDRTQLERVQNNA